MKPDNLQHLIPFFSKVVSTEGDLYDRTRLWKSSRGNYITVSSVFECGMITVFHDRGRQSLPKNWEYV